LVLFEKVTPIQVWLVIMTAVAKIQRFIQQFLVASDAVNHDRVKTEAF
jgi:hypothetical protein